MYTGPMFAQYNSVLRALGNVDAPAKVPYGVFQGMHVCGPDGTARFAVTIHTISSAVYRLSFALPTTLVYRGFVGMRLPRSFQIANKFGNRLGSFPQNLYSHKKQIKQYLKCKTCCENKVCKSLQLSAFWGGNET